MVKSIEIGTYQNKVGYTIYYEGGEEAHFLFDLEAAVALAHGLLKATEDLKYIQKQMEGLSDGVSVKEEVRIKLVGGDHVEVS